MAPPQKKTETNPTAVAQQPTLTPMNLKRGAKEANTYEIETYSNITEKSKCGLHEVPDIPHDTHVDLPHGPVPSYMKLLA